MPTPLLLLAIVGAALTVFIASVIATGAAYRYARHRQWFAVPNARSSHIVPTPSSGGVGFVAVTLALLALLGWSGRVDRSAVAALLVGGAFVAFIGWLDDRRQLRAGMRAVAYALAAAWAVWSIGGVDHLYLGVISMEFGYWGSLIAFASILAFSNFTNFMDGIDGLVGSFSVIVGGVLALLFFRAGAPGFAAVCAIIALTSLGFLVWNWSPAKIFMGDVGSVFLGFSFATVAVLAEQRRILPALLWVILFAPIVVDAGFTTLRRALRGERWWEAHRTFSYQRAVARGYTHQTVVLNAMLLECALVVLAFVGSSHPTRLLPATAVAVGITSVVWGWYQFTPDPRSSRVPV